MKKENIMFAIIGLLVGLIVGFMFANNINRSAINQMPVASTTGATSSNSQSGNPALPADHPPIGTSSGGDSNAGGVLRPVPIGGLFTQPGPRS